MNNKNIHLIGLTSYGGVHSHISHLYEIINVLEKKNAKNSFIHAFTDGRDVDPKSGKSKNNTRDVAKSIAAKVDGIILVTLGRYQIINIVKKTSTNE